METVPDFPLSIEFGEKMPSITFATPEAAIAWIDAELPMWAWAGNSPARSMVPRKLNDEPNRIREVLQIAKNGCQQLRDPNSLSGDARKNVISQTVASLKRAYVEFGAIHSSSPEGQAYEKLQTSPYGACAFYVGWKGLPEGNDQLSAIDGFMRARELKLGIGDRAATEAVTLTNLREEFASEINRLKADGKDAVVAVQTSHEQLKADQAKLAAGSIAQQTDQRNEFGGAMQAAKGQLETLQKTYDEHMTLQAPVAYWSKKATAHRRFAVAFAVGAVSVGSLVFVGLDHFVSALKPTDPSVPMPEHPPWWALVPIGVVALLGIWALRVLVRGLLSQMHLASDAAQRAIVTQVYLSLLRNKAVDEKEHRALALATLFRPVSSGMVKDDAIPQTPFTEIVARVTDSRP